MFTFAKYGEVDYFLNCCFLQTGSNSGLGSNHLLCPLIPGHAEQQDKLSG